MTIKKLFFAFAASLLLATAHANQEAPVQSTMEAFIVQEDRDGEERLTPARSAEPGQIIEWKITFSNVTDSTQQNLVVSGPISEGTRYVADSAATAVNSRLEVSIDNGRSYQQEPVVREVKASNGELQKVRVSPEEYTHVRWNSAEPLAAYASQIFTYRVQVK